MLLGHVSFFIYQYPQVLLCAAALNHIIPHSVLILWIPLTQVQDPKSDLVDLHGVT